MTTQEKNEVIARWMANDAVNSPHLKDAIQLEYHSSWDCLHQVVDKIDEIHDKEFSYNAKKIALGDWPKDDEYMNVIAMPLATPIAEAHDSVFKFIEWYNANAKESKI